MKKTIATLAAIGIVGSTLAATVPTTLASGHAQSIPVCTNPAKGVLTDWNGGPTMLNGHKPDTIYIKNNSKTCAYKVGIASYKAYEPWIEGKLSSTYSQTYLASMTKILKPGEKWSFTIKIPSCTFQTDVYWGDTLAWFGKNHTYGERGRFLDGWYYPGNQQQRDQKRPFCIKPTVTPTPTPLPSLTPTPTPTPTPKPSLTPSPTPTPSVTPTPTPTPSVTPSPTPTPDNTPTPTPTPTPEVLGATPVPTELPSTGPGEAVLIALGSIVIGLIGKKMIA